MSNQSQDLRKFYDVVGRAALATAIGVSVAALTNRYPSGKMPAKWRKAAKTIADQAGAECPDSLFEWQVAAEDAA